MKLKVWFLVLVFVVVTGLSMYPVFFYFGSGIPFSVYADVHRVIKVFQSDSLQVYYILWLLKEAVVGHIPWFTDPYSFSVGSGIHGAGYYVLPFSAISVPFSLLFSVAAGYNVLVVVSFLLSGLFSYLLLYLYTKDRFAALTGAVVFTFFPYHRAKIFGGQLSGFLLFYFPMVVYYLELAIFRKKWLYSLISGLLLFTLYFMEGQLLYYIVLLLGLYLPIRILISLALDKDIKLILRAFLPFILVLGGIVLYVHMSSKTAFTGTRIHGGRSFREILLYSPHWQDLFVRVQRFYERYIYIGAVVLPLSFLSLAVWWKKKRDLFLVLMFLFIGVVFTILSLGPTISWFPLYKAFYKFVPYFKMSRSPGKLIFDAFFAISVLVAFGFREVKGFISELSGSKKLPLLVGIVLFVLVLIDYFPLYPVAITYLPGPNGIHKIIRNTIGNDRMLEISFWPGDSSISSVYLYDVTLTHAKMINGYCPVVSNYYFYDVFKPLECLNIGRLKKRQYDLLKKLDVKYLVVHADAFPMRVSPYPVSFTVRRFKNSPYLRFVGYDDNMWLFEVLAKPVNRVRRPVTSIIGKCYEAEYSPRRVGEVVEDKMASCDKAVYGSKARTSPGHIVFGPYVSMPVGRYDVSFRLKVGDNTVSDTVAIIDIVTNKGETLLYERRLKGTDFKESRVYQTFSTVLKLLEPRNLEFRVFFTKKADLWVDYRYIIPASVKDPLLGDIEAERLFHRAGVLVYDEHASNGRAIYLIDRWDHDIYPTYGPFRLYPKGEYIAVFRLKVKERVEKKVCAIEVFDGSEKLRKVLRGIDFQRADKYEEFSLPFSLERGKILQFRIYFYGNTNLWFDRIRVVRESS